MNAARAILDAIERCGGRCTLTLDNETHAFTACIQPRAYDTQARTQGELSRFGRVDPRQFVYYGPLKDGGELVGEGAVIEYGGGRYEILLCHDFSWRGEALFRWAVAQKLEGGGA